MNFPNISLCIATYKRWNFLKENLPKYLENPYINEIIITDETGEDVEQIQKYFQNPKLKLFVNEKRLHAFLNKRESVLKASNEWVCLIDSDNFAPIEYFEAWKNYIEQNGLDSNTIYAPSRTFKENNYDGFDYSHFLNIEININNVKDIYSKISGNGLLNTGNFILNKNLYLSYNPTNEDIQLVNACPALECLYQNYLFFTKCNAKMFVISKMEYHHIVHDDSLYLSTYKNCDLNSIEKYFK
jgi:hypothetical protein